MLWGRLSYEPSLPDVVFERAVAERFPEVPAPALLKAWSAASMVFPHITRFFWGDIDLRWFPEACLSHPRHRGFYTVRHFIEGETMPGSGILNIPQWREGKLKGESLEGLTPLDVAEMLAGVSGQTFGMLPQLRQAAAEHGGASKELRLTLGDLEAMARLGSYYEQKIRGAAELALFDANGKAEHRSAAVRHLEEALGHWREYVRSATRQYRPQLLNRVGHVNLNALTDKVAADVDLAKSWKPGTVPHKGGPMHADRPFQP
jgi:hypothetical protein